MKYYAVRVGKNTGVYSTWEECQKNTRGFPRAIFKSFTDKAEAEKFIKIEEVDTSLSFLEVFTDGSSKEINNKFTAGSACYSPSENTVYYSSVPKKYKQTNNSCELYGIYLALLKVEGNLKLRIDSDIASNAVQGFSDHVEIDLNILSLVKEEYRKRLDNNDKILFEPVKGHSGNYGNEKADHFANKGRLLEDKDTIYSEFI